MYILPLEKLELLQKRLIPLKPLGQVKVAGELWSAVGFKDQNILPGTEVEIKEIKGVKAIVAPIKK